MDQDSPIRIAPQDAAHISAMISIAKTGNAEIKACRALIDAIGRNVDTAQQSLVQVVRMLSGGRIQGNWQLKYDAHGAYLTTDGKDPNE